jgi:hypothetical protein
VRGRYSESLIAQVETCRKAATPELAKALDRVFATPGFIEDAPGMPGKPGTFGRLVVRLRNLPFPASFRSFAPHEEEATALYIFEHSLIPGLLQTEAYARAILETHPDVTEDVVNERLAGRLSRQAILERDDPPLPVVCALIDRSALNREIGGPVAMRDQLVHLVAMSPPGRTGRTRRLCPADREGPLLRIPLGAWAASPGGRRIKDQAGNMGRMTPRSGR